MGKELSTAPLLKILVEVKVEQASKARNSPF